MPLPITPAGYLGDIGWARKLLHLVAKEPDLTLEEIRKRLRREKKLGVAVSSVWRFYDRHEVTFKKKSSMRVSRIGLTSRPRERR